MQAKIVDNLCDLYLGLLTDWNWSQMRMTWKEHILDVAELHNDETPEPRLFEVVRYMLDKPIAIPRRVLEDYICDRIENAWESILVALGFDKMEGKESEWKNVQWVAHTSGEAVPYVSFATIDMGE